jgi:N-methylhydantoinase A
VQVISLRLVVSGATPKPELPPLPAGERSPEPFGTARAWLDGGFRAVPLYRRGDFRAGHSFAGPAVIPQDDCTTVVPPGATVTVDRLGNLRIAVDPGQAPPR